MMLYARINKDTKQMVGEAQELPAQYNAGDGVVITGFNRLGDKALAVFGWVPVIFEDNPDPQAYYRESFPVYDPVNDRFIYEVAARDVAQAIAEAEAEIDRAASDACSRHISTGAGQDMRYLEKHAQAGAYMAQLAVGNEVLPDDYPMVKMEAEACGVPIEEKAQEIVGTRAAWMALAANVEALRIGGKKAVRGMASAVDVAAKKREIISALEAI